MESGGDERGFNSEDLRSFLIIVGAIAVLEVLSIFATQLLIPYFVYENPEKGEAVAAIVVLGTVRLLDIGVICYGFLKREIELDLEFRISYLCSALIALCGVGFIVWVASEFFKDGSESNVLFGLLLVHVGVGPLTEEIVFRGAVYGFLREKWGIIVSAILSSSLFAVMHLMNDVSWVWIAIPFAGSFVMSFIYEYSKSIAVCAILHMGFNFVAILFTA
jgi:membrane protease YdiL (CAAX protease family)